MRLMGGMYNGSWTTIASSNQLSSITTEMENTYRLQPASRSRGGRSMHCPATLIPALLFRSEKRKHVCGAGTTTATGGGRVAGVQTSQQYVPNDPHSHPPLNVDTHSCQLVASTLLKHLLKVQVCRTVKHLVRCRCRMEGLQL